MRIIPFSSFISGSTSPTLRYANLAGIPLFSVHAFSLTFQPLTFIEADIIRGSGIRVQTQVGPLDMLLYSQPLDKLPLCLAQIPGVTDYWKTLPLYSEITERSETLQSELAEKEAEEKRKLEEAEHIQRIRREERVKQEEISLSTRFKEFYRKIDEWRDIFPEEGITVTETGGPEYALKYTAHSYIVNSVGDKFWISVEHYKDTPTFTIRVSKYQPANHFQWYMYV